MFIRGNDLERYSFRTALLRDFLKLQMVFKEKINFHILLIIKCYHIKNIPKVITLKSTIPIFSLFFSNHQPYDLSKGHFQWIDSLGSIDFAWWRWIYSLYFIELIKPFNIYVWCICGYIYIYTYIPTPALLYLCSSLYSILQNSQSTRTEVPCLRSVSLKKDLK